MSRKAAAPDYRTLIKKSLLKIEQLQAKLDAYEQARREPIAIIGMGCRFPGADDPAAFWQLLRDGVDAITEVPASRWDIEALYDADPEAPGKMSTRYGGFLKQVDQFDAQFFGIAPREAISLDPQHRLLLEVSWEALENANLVPEQLYESQTGVFVGISSFDYAMLLGNPVNRNKLNAYAGTGAALSAAAGRLSYSLGLTGPSMAVDTACSSSLLSLHLACQSLRQNECDMALAGGVNVLLVPEMTINFSKARMMAPDGRCKTFDAAADGYVRSEGSGMIVLKRLSDAQAAGDHIFAVIRGSAINQDGPSGGLTVPSGPSQEKVIRAALDNAGVKPAEVSYVEAHGTGTSLGDPIEVGALAEVFGKGRAEPLRIGSLKTNLGHLEGAAGIAGVIKTVLALKHEELPPHLHFKTPSPFIKWDEIPIEVITERTKWASQRIAGVSSFGFSGTNAHVILAAAPPSTRERAGKRVKQERPLHLLTLSAKREEALKDLARRYEERLAQEPNEQDGARRLADICFTANTARSHFSHRLSLLASSPTEMRAKLHAFIKQEPDAYIFVGEVKGSKPPKIGFLFTGQGSQYVGMGRELYESQPIFRRIIEQCDDILQANGYLKTSLLTILYPERHGIASPSLMARLDQTAYTQPALFALEYALAEIWKSWGVLPDVVMGHSVGEYVAACVAGVFSLEDGLKLVAERGRLMQALPKGGQMVALTFAEDEKGDHEAIIAAAIAPYRATASIAALNGTQTVVISGEKRAVQAVIADLRATLSFNTKILNTSHAFHSPLMQPMLADFGRVARFVSYSAPRISLISNLTGKAATKQDKGHDNITSPHYWVRHVREPVRFADGLEAMIEQGVELLVEIGPKATLLGMARRHLSSQQLPVSSQQSPVSSQQSPVSNHPAQRAPAITNHQSPVVSLPLWLPSLRQGHSDWQTMLRTLAQLYVRGAPVDWAGFDEFYQRERLSVPTYPFQRQRYWFEETASVTRDALLHDAQLRKQREGWLYDIQWRHLNAPAAKIAPGSVAAEWLIFADRGGIGEEVAELLKAQGLRTLIVAAGDAYQRVEEEYTIMSDELLDAQDEIEADYYLNPANSADFQRLLKEALGENGHERASRKVLYLWGLDEQVGASSQVALRSALYLVQALEQAALPAHLWLITRGAQAVGEMALEAQGVAQAPLWGFGRVIATEMPNLQALCLDLAPVPENDEPQTIMTELLSPESSAERQIAYRNNLRYVARLVPSLKPLPDKTFPQQEVVSAFPYMAQAKDIGKVVVTHRAETSHHLGSHEIRPDSSYLITGGLGALGRRVAHWLVEEGATHLVLTGRRGAASEAAQEALHELEEAGATVLVLKADVAKEADVARVLSEIEEKMPPLSAIIHAAGVLDDGLLTQQNWSRFERVMAPKIAGAWNLHKQTEGYSQNQPLQVYFSSIASVLGSPGQSNYAAANAFMDALAHHRQAIGLPTMSINWGPWAEIGMAAQTGADKRLAALGLEAITPQDGLQVLAHLLAQPSLPPQVSVMPINWSKFLPPFLSAAHDMPPFFSELAEEEQSPDLLANTKGNVPTAKQTLLPELAKGDAFERQRLLQDYLQSEVATVLALPKSDLNMQQPLVNLGLDSLMAVELKNRIMNDLELDIPIEKFIEANSLTELADSLLKQLALALIQLTKPEEEAFDEEEMEEFTL